MVYTVVKLFKLYENIKKKNNYYWHIINYNENKEFLIFLNMAILYI